MSDILISDLKKENAKLRQRCELLADKCDHAWAYQDMLKEEQIKNERLETRIAELTAALKEVKDECAGVISEPGKLKWCRDKEWVKYLQNLSQKALSTMKEGG